MLYDTDNNLPNIYSHNMFCCIKKLQPYTVLCVCVSFGFYTACVKGNTYDPYFKDEEASVSQDWWSWWISCIYCVAKVKAMFIGLYHCGFSKQNSQNSYSMKFVSSRPSLCNPIFRTETWPILKGHFVIEYFSPGLLLYINTKEKKEDLIKMDFIFIC